MKDGEIRALVLKCFYDHRREGWMTPEPSDFSVTLPMVDIYAVCDQLAEHSLIEWKSLKDMRQTTTRGVGKITAFGVDAVESEGRDSSIKLVFPMTQNINIHGQSNVQVGDHNNQSFVQTFSSIIEKIENSSATAEEKVEAKARLKSFLEHPLVTSLIGGVAGGLAGLLK